LRVIYRVLSMLLAPVWLLVLALRQKREARFRERLGFYGPMRQDAIWIQAASVGEVRLALRLKEHLERRGVPVTVTSTTGTGLTLLAREGGEAAAFPIDLVSAVRRAFRRIKPRMIVLVETELWPHLLRRAALDNVPVCVVNGRLSDRNVARTVKLKALYGGDLSRLNVAAQSERHALRFHALGVPESSIRVTGNMKFDLEPPEDFMKQRGEIMALLDGAAVWVAGSVREGEERAVITAHGLLRKRHPGVKLLLAPRHLDRVGTCREEAEKMGLAVRFRSSGKGGGPWDVLVLDTIGELWAAYECGLAAFVGGSLVPLGGQNVLEPAYLGKPVVFGPFTENFLEEAEGLLLAEGAVRIGDSTNLAGVLSGWITSDRSRKEAGRKAAAYVQKHRGAAGRTAEAVLECLS
jgi:3-deoxy-D-manno-octulosonic-acid transferase